MVFLRSISVPCPYHPRTCTFKKLIVLLRTLNCIHMGKGLGLIGNFRGRVGNVIGYELKNSRDKVTQGLRQWQPYVKNPQTLPQIRQRAKLQNINNVYRALEPIISRGFENVEYGDKSRNYFMKLALTSESVPFTIKDDKNPVPADYIISEGSLLPISIRRIYVDGSNLPYVDMLLYTANVNFADIQTYGDFYKNLAENNPNIENGDEITFVEIVKKKNIFIYNFASIVIDIDNDRNIALDFPRRPNYIQINGIRFYRHYPYIMYRFGTISTNDEVIGGAVIVSRPYGEQRRLRSTSRIWFDETKVSDFYSEAAMNRAYLSYMKQTWNRDWPEQPLTTPNQL